MKYLSSLSCIKSLQVLTVDFYVDTKTNTGFYELYLDITFVNL